jgi:hypothetical protein
LAGSLSYFLNKMGVSFLVVALALVLMSVGLFLFFFKFFAKSSGHSELEHEQISQIQKLFLKSLCERFKQLHQEIDFLLKHKEVTSQSSQNQNFFQKKWLILDCLITSLEIFQNQSPTPHLGELLVQKNHNAKGVSPILMKSLIEAEWLCAKSGVTSEGTVLADIYSSLNVDLLQKLCRFPWLAFSLMARHGSVVLFFSQETSKGITLNWTNTSIAFPDPFVESLLAEKFDPIKSLRVYFLHLDPDEAKKHDKIEGALHLLSCLILAKACHISYSMKVTLKGPILSLHLLREVS